MEVEAKFEPLIYSDGSFDSLDNDAEDAILQYFAGL